MGGLKNTIVCCVVLAAQHAVAAPLFEDKSDALPEHSYTGGWEHFVGGGVAVFDCNGDDLPDIFAAGGENPAALFVNRGEFSFEQGKLQDLRGVVGAYPLDIDADGFQDLFVLRAGPNTVLRGARDCTFSDATQSFGFVDTDRWSTAFTAWWDDGAEKPSMAVGNYVDRTDPDGPFEACDVNEILTPTAQGYQRQDLAPGFCALSILTARDARGRTTLRLSNDRHYYVQGGYEQMWDVAERRFLTEADSWPTVSLWGMGIASRDLTGDGRDEVMLTSMGDQLMQIATETGAYVAAPYSIGTYAQRPHVGDDGRPSTGWHAEFGDVDNDGLADLFLAKGNVDQMPGMAMEDPNNLLMQRETGRFEEVADAAGVATTARSRGAALADFDGDGRLDLVVSNRRAPLELYRNVTADRGNWLAVRLRQPGGNRDAIGAVLTVKGGPVPQSVQHVVGGGHAGGQLLPRHFGLGEATTGQVTVTWPDGKVSEHVLPAGQTHTIKKPD